MRLFLLIFIFCSFLYSKHITIANYMLHSNKKEIYSYNITVSSTNRYILKKINQSIKELFDLEESKIKQRVVSNYNYSYISFNIEGNKQKNLLKKTFLLQDRYKHFKLFNIDLTIYLKGISNYKKEHKNLLKKVKKLVPKNCKLLKQYQVSYLDYFLRNKKITIDTYKKLKKDKKFFGRVSMFIIECLDN